MPELLISDWVMIGAAIAVILCVWGYAWATITERRERERQQAADLAARLRAISGRKPKGDDAA